MSIQEGSFIQHYNNDIKRIREIITDPNKLYNYFDELKNIHQTLENLIDQFVKTSVVIIKQEIYKKILQESVKYQSTLKDDLKIIEPENYFSVVSIPSLDVETPDFYSDEVYDELLQFYNPNSDPNDKTDQKNARKYKKLLVEILNETNEITSVLMEYQNKVLEYRDLLENYCRNFIQQVYKAHLSYAKYRLLKKSDVVNLVFEDESVEISGKQTEIIPKMLKKYLNLD